VELGIKGAMTEALNHSMWVNFWLHAAFFVQNKISCPGKQLDWSLLDRALSRKAL